MPDVGEPRIDERPRRRRGTEAQTRERLLAVALELLQAGGEAAVSTVSVTRAAGIAQSAFYRHFANVEECLAVVAERAAQHIRAAIVGGRRVMYQADPGTGTDLEQSYRALFGLVARQRPVVQLFLRYRSDPLALKGVMHRLAGDLRAVLAADLTEQVGRAGLTALPTDWIGA